MKGNRRHFIYYAVVLALLCCSPGWAGDPYVKGTDVTIKTVEPDIVRGALLELSLAGGAVIRTADREKRRIPTDELVRISVLTAPRRRGRRHLLLKLRGGDVLFGRLAAPADSAGTVDAVVLDTVELGRLSIPLDRLARLDTVHASRPEYGEVLSKFNRGSGDREDRVLLTNADVIRGFVSSIDAEGVVLEGPMGETRIDPELILTVHFGAAESPALNRPYLVITLHSGGQVSTSELNWSASTVEVPLRFGQRVQIEPERIVRVDLIGGRWEWLGEHRPISFEHTPMLSLDWPYVVDRNVMGGPMKVAGETFEHGVGVHSRSSLTYDLKGNYAEFVTSMGIDDDSGPYADVTAIILVDGKRRWFGEHVRRGTLLGPVRLDVRKAKRIELVVDFGDNGDLQDRFNWVGAALIR